MRTNRSLSADHDQHRVKRDKEPEIIIKRKKNKQTHHHQRKTVKFMHIYLFCISFIYIFFLHFVRGLIFESAKKKMHHRKKNLNPVQIHSLW